MAAFEKVSRLTIQPLDSKLELVDLRKVTLPFERPPIIEDFDPRDFRQPKVIIKPRMAYFNMLRACFGAGMMGIPMAMSQTGIIVGPVLCVLIGFLLVHTHLMLLWCLNDIGRQLKIPFISYRYGFRIALLHGPPILHSLGRCGPLVVGLFMVLSQLGICSVCVIFTADNLRDLMDWKSNETSLIIMFIPLMILEVLMKNLKIISHLIMGVNVMTLTAMILVVVQVIRGPGREYSLFPQGWISSLVGIGTMMFNLSAVGVILSCEKALKNPKIMTDRNGVVSVGLLVPTAVSVFFGVLGYVSMGVMEENILRYLPYDDVITLVAFGLYVISVSLSYPLACYPAVQIVIEILKNHDPNVTLSASTLKKLEFVLRPIFLVTTFFIAYNVPFQAPFVAFVGNMCTSLLSLVFPALMEIGLCYPHHYGRYDFILLKDLLIVLFGLVCWIGGICLCGYLIYLRLETRKSPTTAFTH